jgi:hypothetical protein
MNLMVLFLANKAGGDLLSKNWLARSYYYSLLVRELPGIAALPLAVWVGSTESMAAR